MKVLCFSLTSSLLILLSLGCVSIPGSNRKAFTLLPRSQELAMGDEAFRQVLAKNKLSKDARLNAMLKRVGLRIAQVSGVSDFKWDFALIESKELNAFCLPGGKVAFYTGILPSLDNEAGMAIVMGHEVAHAVARHGAERVSQGMIAQFGLAVIDVGILQDSRYRETAMALLGVGVGVGMLPFSRGHESQADQMGLQFAAKAGYNPTEGVRFWQRFSKATGSSKPPEWLSTHPSDSKRIENMQNYQQDVAPLYKASPQYGTGEKI
jgi:predicted Zn-dependent protease